jgi:hypothetical protein
LRPGGPPPRRLDGWEYEEQLKRQKEAAAEMKEIIAELDSM